MASHLVSLILLNAWFAWCLVWDVGTLGNTISGCTTQDPRGLFVWLRARVRPSVVHVGWYINGLWCWFCYESCCPMLGFAQKKLPGSLK